MIKNEIKAIFTSPNRIAAVSPLCLQNIFDNALVSLLFFT
jgi:hypothetical protein